MGTVVATLQAVKQEGPPRITLDDTNSSRFRKAATVFAHRSKDPATVLKAWGRNKGKADDVLVVSSSVAGPHAHAHAHTLHPPQSDGAALHAYYSTFTDLYMCDKELFAAAYEPTGMHPHEYFKRGTVRARRMDEPFAIRTGAPLVAPPLSAPSAVSAAAGAGANQAGTGADASAALLGSIEQGNSGDWVLQNDATGDQWVVDARTMQATYVLMQDEPTPQRHQPDLLSPSAAEPSSPSAAASDPAEARLTGLGGGVLADCSTQADLHKQAQQQSQPQQRQTRATVTRASSTSVADLGAY